MTSALTKSSRAALTWMLRSTIAGIALAYDDDPALRTVLEQIVKEDAFWVANECLRTAARLGLDAVVDAVVVGKPSPQTPAAESPKGGGRPPDAIPSIALQSAIVEDEVAKERARCLGLVDECIDNLACMASGSTRRWSEDRKIQERMEEMRGLARKIDKLRRPGGPSEETDS